MYNFLVIDDQQNKYEEIKKVLDLKKVNIDFIKDPYDLLVQLKKEYQLILLDMSFPEDLGGNLGGINILNRLTREKYKSPVIVFTQFFNIDDLDGKEQNLDNWFSKNCNYNNVSNFNYKPPKIEILPDLHEYLSSYFPTYYGCILYNQSNTSWINNLKKLLKDILPDENIVIGW